MAYPLGELFFDVESCGSVSKKYLEVVLNSDLVSEILDSVKLVSMSWHFHSLGQNKSWFVLMFCYCYRHPARCTIILKAVSNAPRGQRAEWMLRVQVGPFGCKKNINQSKHVLSAALSFFPLAPSTCVVGDELVFDFLLHVFFPIILVEMILLALLLILNSKGLFRHVGIPPLVVQIQVPKFQKCMGFTVQNEPEALWDLVRDASL